MFRLIHDAISRGPGNDLRTVLFKVASNALCVAEYPQSGLHQPSIPISCLELATESIAHLRDDLIGPYQPVGGYLESTLSSINA